MHIKRSWSCGIVTASVVVALSSCDLHILSGDDFPCTNGACPDGYDLVCDVTTNRCVPVDDFTPVGEGEGEGEGEGIIAEGEGEGIIAEGEGEGIVVGEGEGEGEGIVVAEGEGEGIVVAEGEGEGEGAPAFATVTVGVRLDIAGGAVRNVLLDGITLTAAAGTSTAITGAATSDASITVPAGTDVTFALGGVDFTRADPVVIGPCSEDALVSGAGCVVTIDGASSTVDVRVTMRPPTRSVQLSATGGSATFGVQVSGHDVGVHAAGEALLVGDGRDVVVDVVPSERTPLQRWGAPCTGSTSTSCAAVADGPLVFDARLQSATRVGGTFPDKIGCAVPLDNGDVVIGGSTQSPTFTLGPSADGVLFSTDASTGRSVPLAIVVQADGRLRASSVGSMTTTGNADTEIRAIVRTGALEIAALGVVQTSTGATSGVTLSFPGCTAVQTDLGRNSFLVRFALPGPGDTTTALTCKRLQLLRGNAASNAALIDLRDAAAAPNGDVIAVGSIAVPAGYQTAVHSGGTLTAQGPAAAVGTSGSGTFVVRFPAPTGATLQLIPGDSAATEETWNRIVFVPASGSTLDEFVAVGTAAGVPTSPQPTAISGDGTVKTNDPSAVVVGRISMDLSSVKLQLLDDGVPNDTVPADRVAATAFGVAVRDTDVYVVGEHRSGVLGGFRADPSTGTQAFITRLVRNPDLSLSVATTSEIIGTGVQSALSIAAMPGADRRFVVLGRSSSAASLAASATTTAQSLTLPDLVSNGGEHFTLLAFAPDDIANFTEFPMVTVAGTPALFVGNVVVSPGGLATVVGTQTTSMRFVDGPETGAPAGGGDGFCANITP